MIWIGHFGNRHSPRLKFSCSRKSDGKEIGFEGIIDTGFTGFIQIPLVAALALGIDFGTHNVIVKVSLANGTIQQNWLKPLSVVVQGETVGGICHVSPAIDSPVLIGMEFLRRSGRALVVSDKIGVALIREQDIPNPQ